MIYMASSLPGEGSTQICGLPLLIHFILAWKLPAEGVKAITNPSIVERYLVHPQLPSMSMSSLVRTRKLTCHVCRTKSSL